MPVPAEPSVDTLAGQLIGGRYRLIGRIGKGGMGIVYEAEHVGLDKRVAVKFLLDKFTDDREVVERFHREARTASRIGHANIIDVTDVGTTDDGRPFLVMELLAGQDLARVISEGGPMPAARAVHITRQLLQGLDAAHAKGIVHRDMKPENVFLVHRGEDPDFVKVMDFGISKLIAANESKVRLTATGAVIGTPIYMAPEQVMAQTELDQRVDLYAVGVMLFELLAGRPPFIANSYLGLVTQHLQAQPPSLASLRPDLPPALVAAVHHALEKDPAQRFQTALEFARALPSAAQLRELDGKVTLGDTDGVRSVTEGARAASPVRTVDTGEPREGLEPARRRSATWIVLGAAALAVGMIVVAATMRDRGGNRGAGAAPAERAGTGTGTGEATATPPAPQPRIVAIGKLEVRTTPPGARVYVDDDDRGTTPIVIDEVEAGRRELRIELGGHLGLSTFVTVVAGETLVVAEALTPDGSAPVAKTPAGNGAGTGTAGSATKRPKTGGAAVKAGAGTSTGTDTGTGTGTGTGGNAAPKKDPKDPKDPKKTGRPGQKPNPYDDDDD